MIRLDANLICFICLNSSFVISSHDDTNGLFNKNQVRVEMH